MKTLLIILIIWNIILTIKILKNKLTSKEIDGEIVIKHKNQTIYKTK